MEEVQTLVKDFIVEQQTDNPSAPIMYMLVESVREWLLDNNVKGDDGSAWSSMMKREAAKKKEEEGESVRREGREGRRAKRRMDGRAKRRTDGRAKRVAMVVA